MCEGSANDTYCLRCSNGTITTLDRRKCIQATASQCQSMILHCSACEGSMKSLDQLNCNTCDPGYQRNSTNQCLMNCRNLSSYCNKCTDSVLGPVCLNCENFLIVGMDQRSCTPPSQAQCSSVVSECITCQGSLSAITCFACSPGYNLNNNTC